MMYVVAIEAGTAGSPFRSCSISAVVVYWFPVLVSLHLASVSSFAKRADPLSFPPPQYTGKLESLASRNMRVDSGGSAAHSTQQASDNG
jgi:hypothetical protein